MDEQNISFLFNGSTHDVASNRIKQNQLSQSSTKLTFVSVAVVSCGAIGLAAVPELVKFLKTQELAPGPGGPWVPLNPDGPRRP